MKKAQILGVGAIAACSMMLLVAGGYGGGNASAKPISLDEAIDYAETILVETAGMNKVEDMRVYLRGVLDKVCLYRYIAGDDYEMTAAVWEGARGIELTSGLAAAKIEAEKQAVTQSATQNAAPVVAQTTVASASTGAQVVQTVAKIAPVTTELNEVKAVTETEADEPVATKKASSVLAEAMVMANQNIEAKVAAHDDVEVPKTGKVDDEVETTSRALGIVFGTAVVVAAIGSIMIVRKMKQDL